MKTVKMTIVATTFAVFGLAASPALFAQGCCGGGAMKGCSMGSTNGTAVPAGHCPMQAAATPQNSARRAVFKQPVQAVFDSYIQVQQSLALDSMKDVPTAAAALLKAVQDDSTRVLPAEIAQQATALSKAKNLESARAALKPLSESLLKYVKTQKVPAGSYFEAYCPMAKASWLQVGRTVMNPYMGKSMPHCGQIRS